MVTVIPMKLRNLPRNRRHIPCCAILLILFLILQGCALTGGTQPVGPENIALYRPLTTQGSNSFLQRYAPYFKVEDYQFDYNRIGVAAARPGANNDYEVYIDTSRPTIYTMVRKFTTDTGSYTNLIYRVNFPAIPWPRLAWGRNVGLLVFVTLNSREEPVLITIVHTCGCYLAMIPTSKLPRKHWPADWPSDRQDIYGEELPCHLDLSQQEPYGQLIITLKGETHRVKNVEFRRDPEALAQIDPATALAPMSDLENLPFGKRRVSFFEMTGNNRGYVKGSSKPLEMLFMSWWSLDPDVGRDKALGSPEESGVTLYTSLKFWARSASNIWYFPRFLKYWGWNF